MLLPQSYSYPNFSDGADGVGGQQLRGDIKECPFQWRNKSELRGCVTVEVDLLGSVDVKQTELFQSSGAV